MFTHMLMALMMVPLIVLNLYLGGSNWYSGLPALLCSAVLGLNVGFFLMRLWDRPKRHRRAY